MTDINLTQTEADTLISMPKLRVNDDTWDYPNSGGSLCVPLVSQDNREEFNLDIYRGRINLLKGTHQSRARQVIVLVRLDFGGSPHRNPNDEEIGSPHLHIYREGYGHKWAIPVPEDKFPNISDLYATLLSHLKFLGAFSHD